MTGWLAICAAELAVTPDNPCLVQLEGGGEGFVWGVFLPVVLHKFNHCLTGKHSRQVHFLQRAWLVEDVLLLQQCSWGVNEGVAVHNSERAVESQVSQSPC